MASKEAWPCRLRRSKISEEHERKFWHLSIKEKVKGLFEMVRKVEKCTSRRRAISRRPFARGLAVFTSLRNTAALRGAQERGPLRGLRPAFVVHLEYSNRAFMNGSHENAYAQEKLIKHHYQQDRGEAEGIRYANSRLFEVNYCFPLSRFVEGKPKRLSQEPDYRRSFSIQGLVMRS